VKQKHFNWISSNSVTLIARPVWVSHKYNRADKTRWQSMNRDTGILSVTSTWQTNFAVYT